MLRKSAAKGLWPAHLKPKEDELLSSWLTRSARMHGLAPNTFCSIIWSNHRLPDDIDLVEDSKILKVVAEGTGVPISRVVAATLPAYKDNLLENSEYPPYPWIMPVDFTPRNRFFGLQYCPKCLSEDKEPYFRRKWRLAFVTLCEKHFAPLLDCCAHCGSCITSLIRRAGARQNQIVLCPSCNVDLRTSPQSPTSPEINAEVAFLKYLEETLRKGWVEITESSPVYSQLYFKVLHGLMTLLSTNSSASWISKALCQYYNIPQVTISLPERAPSMERLRIKDRRALLQMIRLLLNEWPSNFIKFWERRKPENYNLFLGEFSKYSSQKDIPFWFWVVLHDFVVDSDHLGWQETYAVRHQCQQGEESWSNKYLAVLHSGDKGSDKELTDEQWMLVAPLFQETLCLSGRNDRRRRTSRDVLSGVLWKLRCGARWQDLPKRFPAVQTCHTRFKQWVDDGTLRRVLELLACDLEERGEVNLAEGFIDGTYFFVKNTDEAKVLPPHC